MKTETNVGNDIVQKEGAWEFDDGVAQQFDEHVKRSIPTYTQVQHHVAKIADWYLSGSKGQTVYDLGCATGTTIKRLIETQEHHKDITFVGIDEARPMLKQAEDKLGIYDNVRLVEEDLSVNPQFPNANIILSLFTLSFLPEDERLKVLEAAYNDLRHGGALVFVEKTYPEHPRFQAMFREHYFDYKQRSFEAEEVIGKAKALRGQLRPLTRSEYREMLETAGFDEVESWYQKYMWWGVIARKR